MNPIETGILGSVILVVLLFLGMPIAFVMMFVGFIGIWSLTSLDAALPIVAETVYEIAANYPLYNYPSFYPHGKFRRWRRNNEGNFMKPLINGFGSFPEGLGLPPSLRLPVSRHKRFIRCYFSSHGKRLSYLR